MAAWTYDSDLARLLTHEGGYTNHPADPGGPTNFGITIADFRRYVKPGATAADVKAMKLDDAKRIYRAKYWNAMRCDDLPAGVDDATFDYGVNSGIGRAKKVLQRVVGVKADGVLGPATMAKVMALDPAVVAAAICDERLRFLKSLRTWPVFGNGWGRRVAEVKAYSLQLAAQGAAKATPVAAGAVPAPAAVTAPAPGEMAKGVVPLPKPAVALVAHKGKIATAATAGGGAGAGHWWDWLQQHPAEAIAFIGAGVVLVGGVGFAIEHWHRAQQEAPTPGLVPVTVRVAA